MRSIEIRLRKLKLRLRDELFANHKVLWAELILQTSSHFTYVTAHSDSPSFQSLHLRHSSFSNPSLALPTSQLIIQYFHCFTYVTDHSPTLLLLFLHHRIFTYVTWRATHVCNVLGMIEEEKMNSFSYAKSLVVSQFYPGAARGYRLWGRAFPKIEEKILTLFLVITHL